MQPAILEELLKYFSLYGYWVVFFGVMLENAGLPIPGETILLAAGFFAFQGHFHVPTVLAGGAIRAVIWDKRRYFVSRKTRPGPLEKYWRKMWPEPTVFGCVHSFFWCRGK